jgi:hypothetical protein
MAVIAGRRYLGDEQPNQNNRQIVSIKANAAGLHSAGAFFPAATLRSRKRTAQPGFVA